jgi:SAM-dependent methyltransferase
MTQEQATPAPAKDSGCGCDRTVCCVPENSTKATTATLAEDEDVRGVVREKYGAVAQGISVGGCCADADPAGSLSRLGYTAEQAAAIPEDANLGLGCGNPIAYAKLQPGEVVLDLGSGAGIDCFLASREVGPQGKAIGVDMTPPMIERARANATQHGYANVEFRLGEIESLPVADASVDAIISNCVVNLSPDKPRVFREALRVLRPGGRLVLSDLVLSRELSAAQRNDVELYVGCVAGASLEGEYLRMIREAGFDDVAVLSRSAYTVGAATAAEGSSERDAFSAVVSIKVRATKGRA